MYSDIHCHVYPDTTQRITLLKYSNFSEGVYKVPFSHVNGMTVDYNVVT